MKCKTVLRKSKKKKKTLITQPILVGFLVLEIFISHSRLCKRAVDMYKKKWNKRHSEMTVACIYIHPSKTQGSRMTKFPQRFYCFFLRPSRIVFPTFPTCERQLLRAMVTFNILFIPVLRRKLRNRAYHAHGDKCAGDSREKNK